GALAPHEVGHLELPADPGPPHLSDRFRELASGHGRLLALVSGTGRKIPRTPRDGNLLLRALLAEGEVPEGRRAVAHVEPEPEHALPRPLPVPGELLVHQDLDLRALPL